MIICYSVHDIWCVTDVFIFHFRPFFALLPPWQFKKSKFKKTKKGRKKTTPEDIIILHMCTKNYDEMMYNA